MTYWVCAHLLLMKQKEKRIKFIMIMYRILKIIATRKQKSQLLSIQWPNKIKKKKRIIIKYWAYKRLGIIACSSTHLIVWTTTIPWATSRMSSFNKCIKNLTIKLQVLNTRPWLLPTTMTLSWKINISLNISKGLKAWNL